MNTNNSAIWFPFKGTIYYKILLYLEKSFIRLDGFLDIVFI